MCEAVSACRALRKSCSRSTPGGTPCASWRRRAASSARRCSNDVRIRGCLSMALLLVRARRERDWSLARRQMPRAARRWTKCALLNHRARVIYCRLDGTSVRIGTLLRRRYGTMRAPKESTLHSPDRRQKSGDTTSAPAEVGGPDAPTHVLGAVLVPDSQFCGECLCSFDE
jgi:hypothetical protein